MSEGNADARQDTRGHWRPMLVLGLLVVIAMLLPLLVLPRTSERRATQMSADYAEALIALQADVAAAGDVVDLLTDPAADQGQFATVLPLLSNLDAHAEVARNVTSESSLSPWPLAPAEPLVELAPVRDALAAAAPAAEDLVTDLVGVLNYRAAYADMLRIEELPSLAPSRFERFENGLVEMAESELALLDELPSPELLREHRSAVGRAVRGLDDWVEDYVAALWIGDEATIQLLLRDLALLRLELDRELTQRLAVIRTELIQRLGVLADDVSGALDAVHS